MEYLDKLVLLQSGSNLSLLEFLLMMAKLIFLIYSGVLIGSHFFSLYFKNSSKSGKYHDPTQMSKNYIDLITTSKLIGFGLGIVPFIAIIFLYIQLLHGLKTDVIRFLIISFVLFIPGTFLAYAYKHSLHLSDFFHHLQLKNTLHFDADSKQDFTDYNFSVTKLNTKSGWWSLVFLFLSLWIFNGAADLALEKTRLTSEHSLIDVMFEGTTILRFLHFLTAAISLTCAAFIVKIFYWDKDSYQYSDEYSDFAKKFNARIALAFSAIQPVFFIITLILIPKAAVSYTVYGVTALVFVFVFLALHYLYEIARENRYKYITPTFYLLLTIFAFIIIKDQNAFSVANKEQEMKLASLFEEQQMKLKKAAGGEATKINGEEIYKGRCIACHKFDEKLVGPPHRDVLPKYLNNKEGLIKFLLNPVKVDPNYPPMPNQGLKPDEAKAVVEYMFEHFGSQLKK